MEVNIPDFSQHESLACSVFLSKLEHGSEVSGYSINRIQVKSITLFFKNILFKITFRIEIFKQ